MSDERDYKTFLCEYPFGGGRWGFEISAVSHEEAEARLRAMPFARVCGEAVVSIKLPPLHRAWNWLRGRK